MNRGKLSWAIAAAFVLFGCSDVGPGFKNHPVDCAVGIPWADCLPGTAGYNNGGGSQTRALERAAVASQFTAARSICESDLQSLDLEPIRNKVELVRSTPDEPVPFTIAVNDTFPTEVERKAIARWAELRDECIKRSASITDTPPSATPIQAVYIQQTHAFSRELEARVSSLIVSLYQAKLTYGEFAQARYEAGKQMADINRQYQAAALSADHDRQLQEQQLAQQKLQNNLLAWSAYTQAVSARQPQTVYLNTGTRLQTRCFSQRIGNFVTTNCN